MESDDLPSRTMRFLTEVLLLVPDPYLRAQASHLLVEWAEVVPSVEASCDTEK